jgi:hypothetical protein
MNDLGIEGVIDRNELENLGLKTCNAMILSDPRIIIP